MLDVVEFTRTLIRRPSVTPADEGAMDLVEAELARAGFVCRRMKYGVIENLYARYGTEGPNLCFAGHTDVVPVGDLSDWRVDPFAAAIEDGVLVARGACDMKSAIAAFVTSAVAAVEAGEITGSISLLITGDEEGPSVDGTKKVVEALIAEGERVDHCVVGEPTSAETFGDMIKIGRRGSINAEILVEGRQGHVAYPDKAANPLPILVDILGRLTARKLDDGFLGFQPSNLEITTIDTGNTATNVIPARAKGRINIRFNPGHTGQSLAEWIASEAAAAGAGFSGTVTVTPTISGEAFLTAPGDFTALVAGAFKAVSGRDAELSTSGGTSDARFIRSLCPVVELGLVGKTLHAVNEQAPVAEIRALEQVYRTIIQRYYVAFA
ncbi:succinyl-diaminopimelate desuccinylase [Phenylobacterium immobile]|uniref:succinyl-diaminopimelate desuccinylase n=1 Tax=Phenylobacterium immobile TaxID=21 RepID=UPI000AFF8D5D|nr:succinyl-diaminopimelate desuccinylase [Phenylobacterium immobile]